MSKELLRRIPLFADLTDDQLAAFLRVARRQSVPADHLLFREGDLVDAFYLVEKGSVTVYRDAKGKPMQVLARLDEGGYFGEMGLLNRTRRLASARTAEATTLLAIDKADLLQLVQDHPGVELKLRAEIIRRHGMNVSSLLGLAGQRDVRIRLGVDAEIELPDGQRLPVTLENLSLGGIALAGVPDDWEVDRNVRFTLAPPGDAALLEVQGTITWREKDRIGVAFSPDLIGDGSTVHRMLRRFLDPPRS